MEQRGGKPIVDFDHFAEAHAREWVERAKSMRGQCPVAWSDHYKGFWVLSRYREVAAAAKDWRTFSSARWVGPDGTLEGGTVIPPLLFRMNPDELDPPEWKPVRALMNRAFSTGAVEALRWTAEEYTTILLDRRITSGHIDLVLDLANPLPAIITLEIMGLPLEDWPGYAEPFHLIPSAIPGSEEQLRAFKGLEWIIARLGEAAAARRSRPEGDFISQVVTAEVDGKPFSDQEVMEILLQVIGGGVDTTTSLVAHAFWHLNASEADRRRLIDNPCLMPEATDEFLRFYTPVHSSSRTTTRDVEIGGQRLGSKERVLLFFASANRDEEAFANADRFVIDRAPNRHLAFGAGMHLCVGAHLARMLFDVMMKAVLTRLPDYRIIEAEARPYKSYGGVSGWDKMPAKFTPGQPIGSALTLNA